MLKEYKADFHIHSCLSPCGDLDMTPRNIVDKALALGLDLIAISDHNASENIAALIKSAEGTQLSILPGMELTSSEEVHVLALFENLDSIRQFQKIVYKNLISVEIDQRMMQDQVVVNEKDEVEGFNEFPLLGASLLSLEEIVEKIHQMNGLVIASHVDKVSYSIIAQLGFIPDNLQLDGLEISPFSKVEEAREKFSECNRFPIVTFSDAHYLKDLGSRTTNFIIAKPTIREFRMALQNKHGRSVG
jgi:3',5'-nucleoside bisphosphate phosphatase